MAFQPCWWADLLQQGQNAVWRRLVGGKEPMRWIELREKVVSYLGDPPTYLSGFFRDDKEQTYLAVHRCVMDNLRALEARLATPAQAPLMVLAHSLGSTIISNYVWDEQHGHGLPETTSAFQRMHTLASLLTYGSTIPLFVPPRADVECITFPPPELPERLRLAAAWENVYDPDDLLGYPLNDLWTIRHGTVVDDRPIDAGVPIVSMTPFSHIGYDRDDDFLDTVESRMNTILAVA